MTESRSLDPAWAFLYALDASSLQDVVTHEAHLYVAVETVMEEVVMDHLADGCPACVAETLLAELLSLATEGPALEEEWPAVTLTAEHLRRGDRMDGALVGLSGVTMELVTWTREGGQIRLTWRRLNPRPTDGVRVLHRHPREHLTVARRL